MKKSILLSILFLSSFAAMGYDSDSDIDWRENIENTFDAEEAAKSLNVFKMRKLLEKYTVGNVTVTQQERPLSSDVWECDAVLVNDTLQVVSLHLPGVEYFIKHNVYVYGLCYICHSVVKWCRKADCAWHSAG